MKISKFILFALSFIVIINCQNNSKPKIQNDLYSTTGIMGGEEITDNSIFKSVVAIVNVKEGYICTGSIIAPQIVLTAGHCAEGAPNEFRIIFHPNIDYILSAHELDIIQTYSRPVTKFIVNPKYLKLPHSATEGWGDISLMKFAGTLPSGYLPAKLLTDVSLLRHGSLVTVAGYGVNKVKIVNIDPKSIKNLKKAIENGEIACNESKTECQSIEMTGDGILRSTETIIEERLSSEIILNETKGHGTCSGDSGGPAYLNVSGELVLFGVTSRGGNLCDDYGIYTNIQSYIEWIKATSVELLKR